MGLIIIFCLLSLSFLWNWVCIEHTCIMIEALHVVEDDEMTCYVFMWIICIDVTMQGYVLGWIYYWGILGFL